MTSIISALSSAVSSIYAFADSVFSTSVIVLNSNTLQFSSTVMKFVFQFIPPPILVLLLVELVLGIIDYVVAKVHQVKIITLPFS